MILKEESKQFKLVRRLSNVNDLPNNENQSEEDQNSEGHDSNKSVMAFFKGPDQEGSS